MSGVYGGVAHLDHHRETADRVAKENREGFPTFREALRLIVNALCYLVAYPDDVETRYPDGTPPALLEKLKRATKPKERQRTTSKLLSMGYTRVHFCGRAVHEHELVAPRGEVAPHWRRGHWRRQAAGPKHSERKLIWIMPTIVRRDKGEPERGRIYLVDQAARVAD